MKRFLILVFVLVSSRLLAQGPNCAQTLRLARSTYEQGRLHEMPGLLENCLKTGFSVSEKVLAYQLLTQAYIYLEEPEKADAAMLELLRTDPYFTPNPEVDPAEFIALYKTFRTRPIYRLGVKFNLNASQPNVVSYNSISNGTGHYKSKIGFGGGIVGELPVTENLTLNGELQYTLRSFTNTFNSQNPGEVAPHSTSTGTEKQSWISLPISAQYRVVKENKFNPFVSGGVGFSYLLPGTNITGEQKRKESQSIDAQTFDISPQRKKFNMNVFLGAGIKTRIAGGFIVAEVQYGYGLTNVNSSNSVLANQKLLWDYGLVDGIYKLNALSISVGYVQNFFNPKKLKVKR